MPDLDQNSLVFRFITLVGPIRRERETRYFKQPCAVALARQIFRGEAHDPAAYSDS